MNEFQKMQQEEDEFRKQLEHEYMSEVSEQKVLDAVWNQAWEYGHSGGLEEVKNYYLDLSDLAYKCMYR